MSASRTRPISRWRMRWNRIKERLFIGGFVTLYITWIIIPWLFLIAFIAFLVVELPSYYDVPEDQRLGIKWNFVTEATGIVVETILLLTVLGSLQQFIEHRRWKTLRHQVAHKIAFDAMRIVCEIDVVLSSHETADYKKWEELEEKILRWSNETKDHVQIASATLGEKILIAYFDLRRYLGTFVSISRDVFLELIEDYDEKGGDRSLIYVNNFYSKWILDVEKEITRMAKLAGSKNNEISWSFSADDLGRTEIVNFSKHKESLMSIAKNLPSRSKQPRKTEMKGE